jgi:transposase-like protein
MPRMLRPETDWIILPGKTLAEIETIALKSSFIRNNGSTAKIRRELRVSKSNLLRRLDKLGLRTRGRKRWRLTEADLARAFFRHCTSIAAELNISDSTLTKWINKRAPFGVEEK